MHTLVLASNLSDFLFNTCAGHPQMWRYFILGLRPLHNSLGVLGIDFDGTKYKICIAVFSAYPQKETSKVE